MAGAREALDRLRAAGLRVGVVTNQSGIARGLLTADAGRRSTPGSSALLGPFDAVADLPARPDDGCDCRKPAPGLILEAAAELGVDPASCVVIGDIGADVEAAAAAGATGVLVPTAATRAEEVAPRREVAARRSTAAVDLILAGPRWSHGRRDAAAWPRPGRPARQHG